MNEGYVEVLVVLLDVVRIVLVRFPFVNRVEVKSGVINLGGLEEGSKGVHMFLSSGGTMRLVDTLRAAQILKTTR